MKDEDYRREKEINQELGATNSPYKDHPLNHGRWGYGLGRFGDGSGYCLYNPHNYRVYFDFDKATFQEGRPIREHIPGQLEEAQRVKVINSREFFFLWDKFSARVKKHTIEIQNRLNIGWHRIDLGTMAKDKIMEITTKKDQESRDFLEQFIKLYGGASKFQIVNRHSDNKVTQEKFINTIPIKQKWYSKTNKKVYNESNIEFPDASLASNYISNRAIEEIAPQIAESISAISARINHIEDIKVLRRACLGLVDLMIRYVKLNKESEEK